MIRFVMLVGLACFGSVAVSADPNGCRAAAIAASDALDNYSDNEFCEAWGRLFDAQYDFQSKLEEFESLGGSRAAVASFNSQASDITSNEVYNADRYQGYSDDWEALADASLEQGDFAMDQSSADSYWTTAASEYATAKSKLSTSAGYFDDAADAFDSLKDSVQVAINNL